MSGTKIERSREFAPDCQRFKEIFLDDFAHCDPYDALVSADPPDAKNITGDGTKGVISGACKRVR